MIKTIILDFGGVVFTEGADDFMRKMTEVYNVSFDQVLDVLKGSVGRRHRSGKTTFAEFWDSFNQLLGIQEDPMLLSIMWAECYIPMPGMFVLVDDLRKAGYRVIYLSNNMEERTSYLEQKYHFKEKFDDGVFSYVVQANKPDEEIYRAALNIANADPEECVFVDDKEYYLPPARTLGMRALSFVSVEKLREDLRSLGVVF